MACHRKQFTFVVFTLLDFISVFPDLCNSFGEYNVTIMYKNVDQSNKTAIAMPAAVLIM